MSFYVHEYEVEQLYGGPEEGGWWYDAGYPTGETHGPIRHQDDAYELCRSLNEAAREASASEEYSYTSVLAWRSQHFAWKVEERRIPEAFPEHRPHYE